VRRHAKRWASSGGAAVAVLLLSSCIPSAKGGAVPPSAQTVEVTMLEYRFDYRPPTQAGRTVFTVRNTGREGHRFSIFPLPEDMPPIAEQLRGENRRSINSLVDLPQVRDDFAPGESLTVAVDLRPGQRYAFLCLLKTPAGDLHADLGMNTEFRLPGQPPQAALTTTTTTTGP